MISPAALFPALTHTLALYTVVLAGYCYLSSRSESKHTLSHHAITGLLFGCAAAGASYFTIPVGAQFSLQLTPVFIILSLLFATFPAAVICMLIAGAAVLLWNGSVFSGNFIILLAATGIGLAARYLRRLTSTITGGVATALISAVAIAVIGTLSGNLPPNVSYAAGATVFLFTALFVPWLLLYQFRKTVRLPQSVYEDCIDIAYRTDAKGIVTAISPSVKEYLGYDPEEVIGTPIRKYYREQSARDAMLATLLDKGSISNFQVEIRKKDGTYRWLSTNARKLVDEAGTYIGVVGISRDISDVKYSENKKSTVEKRLRQNDKMEAISTLAGGIAHDFNNILAAIIGYAEIAQQDSAEGTPLRTNIDGILRAGLRAKELIRHILIFSRRSSETAIPIEAHLVIKEAINLLRSTVPSTIEIKPELLYRKGRVFADPTELHQVIMNLCTNAAEAMEKTGGTLTIRLEKTTLTKDLIKELPQATQDNYLLLRVTDTGTGISNEIIPRIFEPFFTTRAIKEGAGMGLAVVHGIVQRLNGMVLVDSEHGNGTTISVYLPELIEPTPKTVEFPSELEGGEEHILFVDDEPIIADVTKLRLEKLGYRVTVDNSSTDALTRFKAHPERYDIIITDQTMPEMTGEQLSRAILAIRPGLPIILCTGYSALIDAEKAKTIGIREFMMKPFDQKELAQTIRRLLTEAHAITT